MKKMRLNAELRTVVENLNGAYEFTNEEKYADARHAGSRYFLVNKATRSTLFSWKNQKDAYKDLTSDHIAVADLFKTVTVYNGGGEKINAYDFRDLEERDIVATIDKLDCIIYHDHDNKQELVLVYNNGNEVTYENDYRASGYWLA